ncbi:phospholipid scramblase family protein C343.06c-like [Hevea brasiliensis]|uniref:phospholipid scramblase family protein C343.06c-like n=1 Tax=Hevea brasiliensis TaxID=3981 RepID=UPI0025D69ED4|nr:phospholipid scramblase family protein C343.06c-like [Hevea brasiliensis]
MSWIKRYRFFAKCNKITVSDLGVSLFSKHHQYGIPSIEMARSIYCLQPQRGWLPAEKNDLWAADVDPQQRLILARNVLSKYGLSPSFERSSVGLKKGRMSASRGFAHDVENDPHLIRDFLVQLWIADRKMEKSRKKRRRKMAKYDNYGNEMAKYDNYGNVAYNQYRSFLHSIGRLFSGGTSTEERSYDHGKRVLKQPPPSQYVSGLLKPASPEEALVAPLLARSNLLITRDIEWANLVLGFEQENRYAVVDVCYPQSPVGFIREQSNVIARQLLRLRRPFVAYITDAMGNELFRVRRPFWWITSSIYAEINGKEVGVVHRRWHLWRRIYDLYLGNKQFAVVENPGLWNWTFTLKDINGEVVAQIDRDWRGFGFEIFTDAGQYVIRFGSSDPSSKSAHAAATHDLEVARPLTLSERAVAVALAISLDNDYFSRHGGWGIPFVAVDE